MTLKITLCKGPKDGMEYSVSVEEGINPYDILPDGLYFITYDKENREVESRYYISYVEDDNVFYFYDGQILVCHS